MPAAIQEHLARAGDLARESLSEVRRSVRALRPRSLEQRDLCEALEDLIRKMTAGTSLRADCRVKGQPRSLPVAWEENILRIGQEVLTNVLRHAHASEFQTQLVFAPNEVRLELRDNGHGFDFDKANKTVGHGLANMQTRVSSVGGDLDVSSAPGEGTTILAWVPRTQTPRTP